MGIHRNGWVFFPWGLKNWSSRAAKHTTSLGWLLTDTCLAYWKNPLLFSELCAYFSCCEKTNQKEACYSGKEIEVKQNICFQPN